ncbi:unnamed protein product [Sphenostylis stenocarpa]|uniref:Uncharacterized protein n=1 Tax=Sphenostylis stenocarpa TaxID=92480 RepID=A0AA86SDV2_9FABA|nr:unnamed protein product [Sphenostylis stenocarpa]
MSAEIKQHSGLLNGASGDINKIGNAEECAALHLLPVFRKQPTVLVQVRAWTMMRPKELVGLMNH